MHQIKSVEYGPSLGAEDNVTWAQWAFQSEATEALPPGVSNVSSFLDLTQLVRTRRFCMRHRVIGWACLAALDMRGHEARRDGCGSRG
jgi:hypothetical protein